MQLTTRLDAYLRRSALARFIPQLRQRTPRLYGVARNIVNIALPLRSEAGLARHQIRALDRFRREAPISAQSAVLEIGSDGEGKVLREIAACGAARVVGINSAFDHSPPTAVGGQLPDLCELTTGDARKLQFADESFSAVFSVSVFEHLLDFDRCLAEMYRVLKPGGYVFAEFGPIWSCSIGHHVYAFGDGLEARHHKPETNPIPNYAHLLQTRTELHSSLEASVPPNLLKAILDWTYESPNINRMFFEDYVRSFADSQFELLFLETDDEHLDRTMLTALTNRYPGCQRFDVRNACVLLRKSEQGARP